CRASPRDAALSLVFRRAELAGHLEPEPVEALVGDEQVRAEPDRRNREIPLSRPGQRFLKLAKRLGAGEGLRRPTGAHRREAREEDPLLDLHPSSSRISGAARSTSPAPIVST